MIFRISARLQSYAIMNSKLCVSILRPERLNSVEDGLWSYSSRIGHVTTLSENLPFQPHPETIVIFHELALRHIRREPSSH